MTLNKTDLHLIECNPGRFEFFGELRLINGTMTCIIVP